MIDDKTIDHISKLSRLEFNGSEREEIRQDLNKILDFFGKMNEVNTQGVEPLIFVNEEFYAGSSGHDFGKLSQEDALKNGPKTQDGFFVVPKVL